MYIKTQTVSQELTNSTKKLSQNKPQPLTMIETKNKLTNIRLSNSLWLAVSVIAVLFIIFIGLVAGGVIPLAGLPTWIASVITPLISQQTGFFISAGVLSLFAARKYYKASDVMYIVTKEKNGGTTSSKKYTRQALSLWRRMQTRVATSGVDKNGGEIVNKNTVPHRYNINLTGAGKFKSVAKDTHLLIDIDNTLLMKREVKDKNEPMPAGFMSYGMKHNKYDSDGSVSKFKETGNTLVWINIAFLNTLKHYAKQSVPITIMSTGGWNQDAMTKFFFKEDITLHGFYNKNIINKAANTPYLKKNHSYFAKHELMGDVDENDRLYIMFDDKSTQRWRFAASVDPIGMETGKKENVIKAIFLFFLLSIFHWLIKSLLE